MLPCGYVSGVSTGCVVGSVGKHGHVSTAQGRLPPCGMALNYLHARCPALVANLWDVTDGEIDRFTSALLESFTARDR